MRRRGFEKISYNQFLKDWANYLDLDDDELCRSVYASIKLPSRATARSACYDVFSLFELELNPKDEFKFPTGFKSYMMDDEVLHFYARSGLGFKYVRLANQTGVGDSDYYNNTGNEGHYWVKIRNEGDNVIKINIGDGIAQCEFQKYLLADGDDFVGKERVGGFGSTNS